MSRRDQVRDGPAIPMRGQETPEGGKNSPLSLPAIPMRGQEFAGNGGASRYGGGASHPHEGSGELHLRPAPAQHSRQPSP